jgi:hypothetical protein
MNDLRELRDLSTEDLDAVSGGWFCFFVPVPKAETGGQVGQNDPAQMFSQIMQQLTGG